MTSSGPRRTARVRRTCLSVPGSQTRMLEKARGLSADMVFLDLEDSVSPSVKEQARSHVAQAIIDGGFAAATLGVRINDVTTPWAAEDVSAVVAAAAEATRTLDTIVLPKVDSAAAVHWLDLVLTHAERAHGLPVGAIGIEAQIESAASLVHIDAIASASPRLEALVFGPADFIASIGMRTLSVGEQPAGYDHGDAYHYPLMRILMAARTHGLHAIDGPYLRIADHDGLTQASLRTAALGFDGKWVLHPEQIDIVNAAFTPSQSEFDRAAEILAAYEHAISQAGGARGALMWGEEMLDEASRKMALSIHARGRAAGLVAAP